MKVALGLTVVLLVLAGVEVGAQPPDDRVRVRFVDSQGRAIPYFSVALVELRNKADLPALRALYAAASSATLLPYRDVGDGIGPRRDEHDPWDTDRITPASVRGYAKVARERATESGLSPPTLVYAWVFPNSELYAMTLDELDQLRRDIVNVIEIPGDLGGGWWKEVGDFLYKASRYWRLDEGSRRSLLKKCDAMIAASKAEGDLVWAGHLTFVREHWLAGNRRTGLFARARSQLTPEIDAELPWRREGRDFGRNTYGAYPLKPYLSFKEVLKVNPNDTRALFWTKALPWLNGFTPTRGTPGTTTADYVRETRRVFSELKDELDDYHRFWYVKEVLKSCASTMYVARYWLDRKEVIHEADLRWALDELDRLTAKHNFLAYDRPPVKEILVYLADPDRVRSRSE